MRATCGDPADLWSLSLDSYPCGDGRLARLLDLTEATGLCKGGRIESVHERGNGHKFEGQAAA